MKARKAGEVVVVPRYRVVGRYVMLERVLTSESEDHRGISLFSFLIGSGILLPTSIRRGPCSD